MTTGFLCRLNDIENIPKERIRQQVADLSELAKTEGLSSSEIADIVTCLTTVDLNRRLFEALVFCMIPNETVSPELIEKVMVWILIKRKENEKQVECLLYWIICLLDYQLTPQNAVNEFYFLLWPLLEQFLPICCHLLYTLTQPEDVVRWQVESLQSRLAVADSSPYLCVLLNRFKELNSKFSNIPVPSNHKIDRLFQHKSPIYRQIRASLGSRLSSSALHSASIVIPQSKKAAFTGSKGLLPRAQYAHLDSESFRLNQVYVHDIKDGRRLAKTFHKIALPSQTLSLLGHTLGMHVLMFSRKSVQEQFLRNLHSVLEQSLIYQRNAVSQEIEKLLNDVIKLHCVYQQGFAAISSIFFIYLQSWDGHSFTSQIYKLMEWLVFKSTLELNRFLLRPLYTLFVSGDSQEMCNILVSLSNLIMNQYSVLERREQNFAYLFEENVINSREELLQIIRSLTKFMAELFRMGLYIYPCNNQILLVAIAFYERISYFERINDVSWWTIMPASLVYHSLFSFNAQIMNQICLLFTNYNSVARLPVAQSTNKIQEKVRRLRNCYQDIYNILWSARAFVERTEGHIFRGLSVEDEADWRNYANLNNSLSLEKHIMITPYKMMNAYERNEAYPTTKEEILDIMRNHTPHLVKFLELLNQKIGEIENTEDFNMSNPNE